MKHSTLFMSAALALTLAACTSNDAPAPTPSETASAEATAAVEPSETEDPTEMSEPGAPKYEMIGNYMAIPKGEAADWDTTMYDIEDKHITKTVVKAAECGLEKLPPELFDEAMDDQGNIGGPMIVEPNDGNTFCLITLAVENIGDTPATWYGQTGNALTADGKEFAPAPEDADINYDIDLHAGEQPLNPGQTLNVTRVIQVPRGTEVTHILYPEATLNWEPVYALAIK